MAEKKPDLKTFLEDPSFQGDRDLFAGLFDHWYTQRKAKEEAERKEKEKQNETRSIFDLMGGG